MWLVRSAYLKELAQAQLTVLPHQMACSVLLGKCDATVLHLPPN